MPGLVIAHDRVIAASVTDDSYHVDVQRFQGISDIPRAIREALRGIPGRRSSVTIVLPAERSRVFQQNFLADLDAGKRAKQVLNNDVKLTDYGVAQKSSLLLSMRPLSRTESLVGVAPRELVQQYVDYVRSAGARLHAVEWEAFAWQRLLHGDPATSTSVTIPSEAADSGQRTFSVTTNGTATLEREAPAVTDKALADAIIVGTPQMLTVIVFDTPAPRTRSFSMLNDAWAGSIADFLTQLRVETSARIDARNIAILGDFSQTTKNDLEYHLSGIKVFTLSSPLSSDPLAPLALAAAEGDAQFDFRDGLSRERFSALFERERSLIGSVFASLLLAAGLCCAYLAYTNVQIAALVRGNDTLQRQYDHLTTERKADELHIGGTYGDIAPFLNTIVTARGSGAEFALDMQRIGNRVLDKSWLTSFDEGLDVTAGYTIQTNDYAQGVAFQEMLGSLGMEAPNATMSTLDSDTVQFAVADPNAPSTGSATGAR